MEFCDINIKENLLKPINIISPQISHSTPLIETSYNPTLRAARTLPERFKIQIMILTRNLHMFQEILES